MVFGDGSGADGESAQDPWADSPGLKVGKIVLKMHGSPERDCDSSGLAWGGAKKRKKPSWFPPELSVKRGKNKRNAEKEKNKSRARAFLHQVPRCAAGGGQTTNFSRNPIPQWPRSGKKWIRAPRKLWFSSGFSCAEIAF